MASLSDTAIRQAFKRVEKTGRQENLPDGNGRGTRRLILSVKSMPTRVTAEWMAQQWRGGDRRRGRKMSAACPASRTSSKQWQSLDMRNTAKSWTGTAVASSRKILTSIRSMIG